nr:hypothetical protein CFP56_13128 [Quercus suber]
MKLQSVKLGDDVYAGMNLAISFDTDSRSKSIHKQFENSTMYMASHRSQEKPSCNLLGRERAASRESQALSKSVFTYVYQYSTTDNSLLTQSYANSASTHRTLILRRTELQFATLTPTLYFTIQLIATQHGLASFLARLHGLLHLPALLQIHLTGLPQLRAFSRNAWPARRGDRLHERGLRGHDHARGPRCQLGGQMAAAGGLPARGVCRESRGHVEGPWYRLDRCRARSGRKDGSTSLGSEHKTCFFVWGLARRAVRKDRKLFFLPASSAMRSPQKPGKQKKDDEDIKRAGRG